MDKVTASAAKQNFGHVLERAATAPVGIERHGKLVAALVPPQWLDHAPQLDERRRARDEQQRVEQGRLMAHQRIGIALLAHKDRQKPLLAAAQREVKRWAALRLCSQDYIDRWAEWLALPVAELVERMCSDADGWGTAMRQNSPFAALLQMPASGGALR
ncbi:MAG: type II toxin-antitoxin system Phd/YefM family antitoxin [Ramlibacter sp.]